MDDAYINKEIVVGKIEQAYQQIVDELDERSLAYDGAVSFVMIAAGMSLGTRIDADSSIGEIKEMIKVAFIILAPAILTHNKDLISDLLHMLNSRLGDFVE